MTPRVLPGASYGAFWPDGTGYISLTLPAGLESPLLYFKVSADGRVVGKAQSGNATPYWNGSRWLDLGSCTGVNVAAFHPTSGEVYVSDAAGVRVSDRDGRFVRLLPGYIGSQGIRWVNADGSVVSGDETYGVTGLLGEHFRVGELRIGQGLKGGLDVVDGDGAVRHVCDGRVDFLQVNAVGDAVACYWTDFRDGYLLQTSLSALRALPLLTTSDPPIVNTPPLIVNPKPEPVSMPFEHRMPNRKDIVEQVKAAHADEWAAREDLRFVKRLAWTLHQIDPHFGLLGKRMTDTLAADSIAYLNPTVDPQLPSEMSCEAADVITASHSDNPQPGWSEITVPVREGGAGAKWIKPQPVGDALPPSQPPSQPPPAQPPAPSVDLSAVLARLDLMDKRNAQEFAVQRAATADMMQALLRIAESLDALRTATQLPVVFPNYSGTARLGTSMRFTLEPVKP